MARQVQVTIGMNTSRNKKIYSSDVSIREMLEDQAIDYSAATIHVDGAPLVVGEIDKSLDELGVTGDTCMIIAVVKNDNAA